MPVPHVTPRIAWAILPFLIALFLVPSWFVDSSWDFLKVEGTWSNRGILLRTTIPIADLERIGKTKAYSRYATSKGLRYRTLVTAHGTLRVPLFRFLAVQDQLPELVSR